MKMPFDVCANNHGGNQMSREANLRTDKQADINKILAFMRSRPGHKTYVKEVIRELGLKHQTASARLSDLKAAKIIEATNERAENCGVVRIAEGQLSLFN